MKWFGRITTRDTQKNQNIEQKTRQWNELVTNINSLSASQKTYSEDGTTVIIQGQQPDGTFGIRMYDIDGDNLTLTSTLI